MRKGAAVISLVDKAPLVKGNAYIVAETLYDDRIIRLEGFPTWHWFAGNEFRLAGGDTETKGDEMNNNVSDKELFLEFHKQACERMHETTRRKNADYTGTNDDPFANFRAVQSNGVCSTEQGFLVRMHDKFARITSFVQKGVLEVKDESVEDTLLDLANYCILMNAYIQAEKRRTNEKNKCPF